MGEPWAEVTLAEAPFVGDPFAEPIFDGEFLTGDPMQERRPLELDLRMAVFLLLVDCTRGFGLSLSV